MGTTRQSDDGLSAALFGKGRRSILSLFFGRPEEAFYLRQIARATGVGLGAVQREVDQLSKAGIILRTVRGRQVYYQANPSCPIFSELKGLVLKTAGVADVLRAALTDLSARINFAFVYGSIARGTERRGSDIDLMVIGNVTFAEVVSALGPAQEILAREVNPTIYPPEEFKKKVATDHRFLRGVLEGPKIFLIGDERELKGLA